MKKNVTLCKNCLFYKRSFGTKQPDNLCTAHDTYVDDYDFCSDAAPIDIDFETVKLLGDVLDYVILRLDSELGEEHYEAVCKVFDAIELLEDESDLKNLCYSLATKEEDEEDKEEDKNETIACSCNCGGTPCGLYHVPCCEGGMHEGWKDCECCEEVKE